MAGDTDARTRKADIGRQRSILTFFSPPKSATKNTASTPPTPKTPTPVKSSPRKKKIEEDPTPPTKETKKATPKKAKETKKKEQDKPEDDSEEDVVVRRTGKRKICYAESDDEKGADKDSDAEVDMDDNDDDDDDDASDMDDDEEEASPPPKPAKRAKKTSSSSAAQRSPKTPETPPTWKISPSSVSVQSRNRPTFSSQSPSEKKEDPARYKWLVDMKDANHRSPDHPDYDHRTLYVPENYLSKLSPFERQFWQIKMTHWDVVIFFKKGKFYELYEKDADIGQRELDLKMTDRVNMRMVGVPEKSFGKFASKLIDLGYKVGRVEQVETVSAKEDRHKSQTAKKPTVCHRELCQILTQGTLTDEQMIPDYAANFLVSFCEEEGSLGVCLIDASTGEFRLGAIEEDSSYTQLETLLLRLHPREFVYPKNQISAKGMKLIKRICPNAIHNPMQPGTQFWDAEKTLKMLETGSYFKTRAEWPAALEKIIQTPLALSAFGGCLFYLQELMLDKELLSLGNFHTYDPLQSSTDALVLDGQTLVNLEILEVGGVKGASGSLLRHLNRCVTPFGKRLFERWLCRPLLSVNALEQRLSAVDSLSKNRDFRCKVANIMQPLPDLERLLARIHAGAYRQSNAVLFDTGGRQLVEFVSVLEGFERVNELRSVLVEFSDTLDQEENAGLSTLHNDLLRGRGFPDLQEKLQYFYDAFDRTAAKSNGQLIARRGIVPVHDEAVDAVTLVEEELKEYLAEQTALLKVRDIEYYSSAQSKEPYQLSLPAGVKVPSSYSIMSSTKDRKRYWTPELREMVRRLKIAKDAVEVSHKQIMQHILAQFDVDYALWLSAVTAVANIDALLSLSYTADGAEGVVCRPQFVEASEEGPRLEVRQMRHPCFVSRNSHSFIPNDSVLGREDPRVLLVTGPNMGGKSTLLRQTCVAVVMAQMGCYVPAEQCVLTPVDRIFTRIGASDRIMAGQSTFFVELHETAAILASATSRSFVILDELGRGTSTADGHAIAYAVVKDLAARVQCLCMFATHYHELTTELKDEPGVGRYHMQCIVDEKQQLLTFLYKFAKGVSLKSYGIHCARAAGLPSHVLDQAEEKSRQFENSGAAEKLAQQVAACTSYEDLLRLHALVREQMQ